MITRNKSTLTQFALWVFVAIFSTTVFLGISIYFTDDIGEIYFLGLFTSLRLALLLFGLLSIMMIKNYVSRGQSRRTFFKESTVLTAAISVYALILINIFGWLLNMIPGLAGQILTGYYTENIIVLNLTAFISAVLFYYLGMVIMFSFRKSVLLGVLMSIVLGTVVGYMEFSDINENHLIIQFLICAAAAGVFGYISYRAVKTAAIKV